LVIFFEQQQVITLWPRVHGAFDAKSGGGQLLDSDILGNPMTTTICRHTLNGIQAGARGKFDNGETTARFQGANQGGVEFGRFGEVMVDATQEDRVAAIGGQIGVGVFAFEDGYVGKVAFGHFGAKAGELVLVNFGGEDFAGRADYLGCRKSVLSVARTDVGDDGSRLPFHNRSEALDLVVGVGMGAAEHNRSGYHRAEQSCSRQRILSIHCAYL